MTDRNSSALTDTLRRALKASETLDTFVAMPHSGNDYPKYLAASRNALELQLLALRQHMSVLV
jgi:N-formylglutamate amidohydrolase